MEQAQVALGLVVDEVNALFAGDIAAFRTMLQEAGLGPLKLHLSANND